MIFRLFYDLEKVFDIVEGPISLSTRVGLESKLESCAIILQGLTSQFRESRPLCLCCFLAATWDQAVLSTTPFLLVIDGLLTQTATAKRGLSSTGVYMVSTGHADDIHSTKSNID